MYNARGLLFIQFLSTLSLRRATEHTNNGGNTNLHFYPRSPCGERPGLGVGLYLATEISIHALLAESDQANGCTTVPNFNFYPRSPCGERHVACPFWKTIENFYPRSPCGERHQTQNPPRRNTPYFYPRSPCGERPIVNNIIFVPRKFLSTLSLRRATNVRSNRANFSRISIHALLAESDRPDTRRRDAAHRISIHALLAESDNTPLKAYNIIKGFLSTLSLRRATARSERINRDIAFLSTLSLRRATNVELHDWPPVRISIHALLAESDIWACLSLSMI